MSMFNSLLRVVRLLFSSIISSDILMLVFAFITFGIFMKTRGFRTSLINDIGSTKKAETEAIGKTAKDTSRCYTLFLTFVSIFPLLGMLGTVCGLLGLDLATGDMENIKNNFFIALTSTAWGIIFSGFFKVLNAGYLYDLERLINLANGIQTEND